MTSSILNAHIACHSSNQVVPKMILVCPWYYQQLTLFCQDNHDVCKFYPVCLFSTRLSKGQFSFHSAAKYHTILKQSSIRQVTSTQCNAYNLQSYKLCQLCVSTGVFVRDKHVYGLFFLVLAIDLWY